MYQLNNVAVNGNKLKDIARITLKEKWKVQFDSNDFFFPYKFNKTVSQLMGSHSIPGY